MLTNLEYFDDRKGIILDLNLAGKHLKVRLSFSSEMPKCLFGVFSDQAIFFSFVFSLFSKHTVSLNT